MKRQITIVSVVLSAFLVTSSSQCIDLSSLTSSFSKALQKNAQSLFDQGKDMLVKQSNTLMEQAKKQASSLADQAKTAAMATLEDLKTKATDQAKTLANSAMTTLKDKATTLATDAKNKIMAQAQDVLSNNPIGQKILALMTPAEKAAIENLSPTEKEQVIKNASTQVADTTSQNIVKDSETIATSTAQSVQAAGQQAAADIATTIAQRKSAIQSDIYSKFGKGTPTTPAK